MASSVRITTATTTSATRTIQARWRRRLIESLFWRPALDEAVRAAGVDPGGQVPVRMRALNAAAALISESGLAAVTLEAIATRADCAVHSLYMAFGSRDELLRIVFERHSPIPDFEDALDLATDDLTATVESLYQALAAALGREPRVAPAILAEMFARPASPTVQTLTQHAAPRMLDVLGSWLNAQVQQGRYVICRCRCSFSN